MPDTTDELYVYRANLIEAVRAFTGDKMAEEVADAIERSWFAVGACLQSPGGSGDLTEAAKVEIVKNAFPALIGR